MIAVDIKRTEIIDVAIDLVPMSLKMRFSNPTMQKRKKFHLTLISMLTQTYKNAMEKDEQL